MPLVLPGVVVEGGEGRFLPVWTCYEGLGVTAGELRNNSVMRWSVCLLSLPSHIPPLTSSTYYNWDLSSNILHSEKLRTLALTGLILPADPGEKLTVWGPVTDWLRVTQELPGQPTTLSLSLLSSHTRQSQVTPTTNYWHITCLDMIINWILNFFF